MTKYINLSAVATLHKLREGGEKSFKQFIRTEEVTSPLIS